MMYIAGCMFETTPDETYRAFAEEIIIEPPLAEATNGLQSPIYTAYRFCSTSRATWKDKTLEILEQTRRATNAFLALHDVDGIDLPEQPENAREALMFCHRALLAFTNIKGSLTKEQGLYETVRVACCIFVHALVLRIPLSQAVRNLDLDLLLSKSQIGSSDAGRRESPRLLLELKDAMKSSPFEDCWSEKLDVLLWCGLVGLASVGDVPIQDQLMQQARDFIAAVTLRTAVLQVFNRPVPILGMLRRFVAIQQVLANSVSNYGMLAVRQSS